MKKKKIGVIWGLISHYKYLIVSMMGVLLVVFLDENSILKNVQLSMQIDDLREEITRYTEQNKDNTRRLRELERTPGAIEKVAREQYFMKADDEDIYVLSDDEIKKKEF